MDTTAVLPVSAPPPPPPSSPWVGSATPLLPPKPLPPPPAPGGSVIQMMRRAGALTGVTGLGPKKQGKSPVARLPALPPAPDVAVSIKGKQKKRKGKKKRAVKEGGKRRLVDTAPPKQAAKKKKKTVRTKIKKQPRFPFMPPADIPLPGSGYKGVAATAAAAATVGINSQGCEVDEDIASPFTNDASSVVPPPARGLIISLAGFRRRESERSAAVAAGHNRKTDNPFWPGDDVPKPPRRRQKKLGIPESMAHLPYEMACEFARMKRVLGRPGEQEGGGTVLGVIKGMFDGFHDSMHTFLKSGDLAMSHFKGDNIDTMWPAPAGMIGSFVNNITTFRHVYHRHTEVGLIRQCGLSNTDIIPWEYMYGFYPVRPSKDGWNLYLVRNCFNRIVTSRRGFWTFDTAGAIEAEGIADDGPLGKVLGCVSVVNRRRANEEASGIGIDRAELDPASPRLQGSLPVYDDVTDLFNTFDVRRITRMCHKMGIQPVDDSEARAHAVWVEDDKKHKLDDRKGSSSLVGHPASPPAFSTPAPPSPALSPPAPPPPAGPDHPTGGEFDDLAELFSTEAMEHDMNLIGDIDFLDDDFLGSFGWTPASTGV